MVSFHLLVERLSLYNDFGLLRQGLLHTRFFKERMTGFLSALEIVWEAFAKLDQKGLIANYYYGSKELAAGKKGHKG